MRQALRIAIAATGEATLTLLCLPWPLWPPILWIAGVTAVVALATALRRPGLLGKRPDGSIPWWSYVVFWPWHLAVRFTSWLIRRQDAGRGPSPVAEGWLIGGWPHRAHHAYDAVLDLTCEVPRRADTDAYLCLPTWDGTAVSPEDLERGARWALEQRRAGRTVLVHCNHGRGRCTTMLSAALVAEGTARTWEEALSAIQAARPVARLNADQRTSLQLWTSSRG